MVNGGSNSRPNHLQNNENIRVRRITMLILPPKPLLRPIRPLIQVVPQAQSQMQIFDFRLMSDTGPTYIRCVELHIT